MKKSVLMILLCCLASVSVMAQSTKEIKGAVIDKNGNPLPGAVVEATGGAESATVDADGTFSMEVPVWLKKVTARYAGMESKTKKIKNGDILFELSPKKNKWFVSLVGSYDFISTEMGRIGVMAGYVRSWGGYVKVAPTIISGDGIDIPAITAGVVKSLSNTVNLYLGLGLMPYIDEGEYDYDYWWKPGLGIELGTIINLSDRFNLTAGVGLSDLIEISDWIPCVELQLGFGVRF